MIHCWSYRSAHAFFYTTSAIQREEETAARELKALAKKQGSAKAMHTLAMSIQRARRAQEQMLEAKTHINSSMLALKAHGANVAGMLPCLFVFS